MMLHSEIFFRVENLPTLISFFYSSEVAFFSMSPTFNVRLNNSRLSRPCGVAEQCSRPRKTGAYCLSEASLCAAGVGEPRRGPEELAPAEAGGHATANMVLATFAETKVARLPGRNPSFLRSKVSTTKSSKVYFFAILILPKSCFFRSLRPLTFG